MAATASAKTAPVRLPHVLGDHMVVQQGMEIPVWGWTEPGAEVTVRMGEAEVKTTADADGRWKVALPPREELSTSVEALIHHFKLVTEGFHPPAGEIYSGAENPKGELGFYIISDGSPKPYRLRVRSPSFMNLQAMPIMAQGAFIADIVAIIGSIDIVMGEVDR